MANRYSKTGFTERQHDTLIRTRNKISVIIGQRADKQDSFVALDYLERAERLIKMAQQESEDWVKSPAD